MNKHQYRVFFIIAINGFLVIGLGAFGSHVLKEALTLDSMDTYHTAVQYHMFNISGLLLLSIVSIQEWTGKQVWAFRLFNIGIVLFCGSLYLLAISGLRWLGMITPIGGVALLIAWALVAIMAIQHKGKS